MNNTTKLIFWLLLVVVLAVLPMVIGPYRTSLFITIAIFSVFGVSLNMLLGYTGLLSFGHAIFFGTGGYGTALALRNIDGISLLPAIFLGVLAATILAVAISPIVSRVKGSAFAMVHLAFGMLLYTLSLKLRNITGGEDGIGNFPTPGINLGFFSISMEPGSINFYYLAMIILGASLWAMWFFTQTPFGQVQLGIRENQKRIAYLGYRIPQSRILIYVVSGLFAGVAGSVYAVFHNLVSSDGQYGVLVNFAPITAAIVGGMGNFFGPVVGTVVFHFVEEMAVGFTDRVELVIGALLVIVMMFAPYGVMGIIAMLRMKWAARRSASLNAPEQKMYKEKLT
jgi:branched-chain amino acid transport system permease protein